MRKRFWVGLITCLFATFSVLTLVAIDDVSLVTREPVPSSP